MKKLLSWLGLTSITLLIWIALNVLSLKNGWFHSSVVDKDDTKGFVEYAIKEISSIYKGNLTFALVEKGTLYGEYNVSVGKQVNGETIFAVSSLGKWVAATGVMVLVESGKLDLDVPVSQYLTRWQLPDSKFNNNGVTVRRLLSHTAGLTDGLGHNGFAPGENVQPLVEHLNQAIDADEGISGKVLVGLDPGTAFKYSGGGYNLLQLLVEEVSGKTFETFMQNEVFEKLDMKRTSYRLDDSESNIADYFDKNGKVTYYPRYTSLAATGLYSTRNDLIKFILAHRNKDKSNPSSQDILSQYSFQEMRKVHASMMGVDIWGAGPILFVDNGENDFIVGHDGQSPSLNTTARINPFSGNGIVILETGNASLATDIAMKWTTWEAGKPGMFTLKNLIPPMIKRILIGSLIIIISTLIFAWRNRRLRKRAEATS